MLTRKLLHNMGGYKQRMIFKVQRSLMPPDADCLVYNEDRSIQGQFPVGDDIREAMGEDMKAYFVGTYRDRDGKVELSHRTDEQNW